MTSPETTDTVLPSVSYRSLPQKGQLLILLLVRFTEPLTTSSIHSYVFFQLRYFDPSASAASIAARAGLIVGCKTAAHVCTGFLWGRLADNARVGRKSVLVTGLLASSLATIGYGFSETFRTALGWQVLDGALNAIIAMVRCMTAELNPGKQYRARALTLLPLSANTGSLLGPLVGGFLVSADKPTALFARYPYAAPNICVGGVHFIVALLAFFLLNETLDPGLREQKLPQTPSRHILARCHNNFGEGQQINETSPLLFHDSNAGEPQPPRSRSLPFRDIWTSNVIRTMFAQFIVSGHLGTFASLWAIFLSLPTQPLSKQHLPFHFSGGLGLQPSSVGIAMSVFGFVGIVLQILVYPNLQERWGAIRVWRGSLCVFPVLYTIAPFCAIVASIGQKNETEVNAEGVIPALKWAGIIFILVLFAAGRTGVVPATSLLINDCTPHSSARATVHSAGVIVSNLSRAVFPPIALAVLGYGLELGAVGVGFWFIAVLAVLSCLASIRVGEGNNGEEPTE